LKHVQRLGLSGKGRARRSHLSRAWSRSSTRGLRRTSRAVGREYGAAFGSSRARQSGRRARRDGILARSVPHGLARAAIVAAGALQQDSSAGRSDSRRCLRRASTRGQRDGTLRVLDELRTGARERAATRCWPRLSIAGLPDAKVGSADGARAGGEAAKRLGSSSFAAGRRKRRRELRASLSMRRSIRSGAAAPTGRVRAGDDRRGARVGGAVDARTFSSRAERRLFNH